MATITWAEAKRQMDENYARHQAEIEQHRQKEAERSRLDYEVSIRCGHSEDLQYIEVNEFDMTLCPDCAMAVMWALQENHVFRTNGDRR